MFGKQIYKAHKCLYLSDNPPKDLWQLQMIPTWWCVCFCGNSGDTISLLQQLGLLSHSLFTFDPILFWLTLQSVHFGSLCPFMGMHRRAQSMQQSSKQINTALKTLHKSALYSWQIIGITLQVNILWYLVLLCGNSISSTKLIMLV